MDEGVGDGGTFWASIGEIGPIGSSIPPGSCCWLWGYRRVTIDELARRAGVGKGTIYLHWRSREEVFHAVSAREAAAMADAIVDAVRMIRPRLRCIATCGGCSSRR